MSKVWDGIGDPEGLRYVQDPDGGEVREMRQREVEVHLSKMIEQLNKF